MHEHIPTPSGYDVYWEKWTDAYSPEDIEVMELEEDSSDETSGMSFEEEINAEFKKFKNIQTIFTPFGVLPLTEQSLASTYFKFWVGHTNFKITPKFHTLMSRVEGVESIDVFTPYRFRIGIAKLFIDRTVMSDVRQCMVEYIKENQNGYSQEAHDNRGP